jgi:transposase
MRQVGAGEAAAGAAVAGLYSRRSERLLMEEISYNLLFRRFVGLEMDDEVWDVTVFTKNRERLVAVRMQRLVAPAE